MSGKTVTAQYTYDATNRMVKGVNEGGEESHYIFNGLGYLVGNEWIVNKNSYGYNGVSASPSVQVDGVVVCDRHKNTTGQGHINPTGKGHTTGGTTGGTTPTVNSKMVVIHKDYVLDYTSALKDVILETESGVGGLTYRYVYGLQKVSVGITGDLSGAGNLVQNGQLKLYYHHDRLGTTDFITDNDKGKVISYVTYDDWGMLTAKANLKCGVRELDLVQEYTGHPYDMVLGLYFAEARMYDASARRFVAVDWVRGKIFKPLSLAKYTYCFDNPLKYVDPLGKDSYILYDPYMFGIEKTTLQATLDKIELEKYFNTPCHLKPIYSKDDFVKAWNNMGFENGKQVSIDAVVVSIHGNEDGYGFVEQSDNKVSGDQLSFVRDDIKLLDQKSIGYYISLGCNTGRVDRNKKTTTFSEVLLQSQKEIKMIIAPHGLTYRDEPKKGILFWKTQYARYWISYGRPGSNYDPTAEGFKAFVNIDETTSMSNISISPPETIYSGLSSLIEAANNAVENEVANWDGITINKT